MAIETDINAIPMPELADIANIETATHPALEAIDLQLPSRFASVSARDSAIVSPLAGMITYVTSTNELYVWDGSAWVSLKPRFFYHPVTQQFSSTTLADVNDFTIPLEASSKYLITGSIVTSTDQPAETNNIKFSWTLPSGMAGDWMIRSGPVGEAGPTYHDTMRVRNLEWSNTINLPCYYTIFTRYEIEGLALTDFAGSLVLQAAEATAATGSAYVMQDSYLRVEKVA